LWKRDILERSDRGHVDVPRLIEGHYALQVFSSVTKSPAGQNFNANGADTDSIIGLVKVQLQPMRTWGSLLQRSLSIMRRNCTALPRPRKASCG
jgi:membrane dipeptidase